RSQSCSSAVPRHDYPLNRYSSPPLTLLKQTPILAINFHRENLFGSNFKLKGPTKDIQFRIIFANPDSACLTTKDKTNVLAQLNCKRLLSESYIITPAPELDPEANRIAVLTRRSISLTPPRLKCELIFPSICQIDYPIFIGDKAYSWRPLLINSSWVLVDLLFPTVPLAKFKRRVLDHKLGCLLLYTNLPDSHLDPLILAIGFILFRHRTPQY
ncbi:hypothetical protein DSO57_1029368, partial [Entomophthora muscae]